MQRPILSGMVAMSGLALLTFLRMDERCQQASARAKKVQGAVSLLTTFTLADLIIGHNFAISAFCQSPSACGESWSLESLPSRSATAV